MQTHYYELFFQTDKEYLDLFLDLVFSLDIDAIEEKNDGVYIRSEEDIKLIQIALQSFHQRLCEKFNTKIYFHSTLEKKENKNWIEEYKKGIQALTIDNIHIHTTWQKPKQDKINIIIDPALAFGSGHHESTYTCIEFLQKYTDGSKFCLDVGCGSGILSIIMAKLGAKVQACDTDELAIVASKENAKLNRVSFNDIWVGSVNKSLHKYDIVVANIIADILIILEKDLKEKTKEGGILILSGILNKYEDRIKDKFKDLTLLETKYKGEWLSLAYKKETK
ncbi:50S ribosomal protein L11 methyltransferase [Campylobacter lari]|uniref:Ribosomal protein L11 methyltransferase n=1 Tax=Campylobacter lari (strain RM2100 / D67 / ATCC BAA-1060) TaxID=306263 RepID=PRMA_CAMLR|nr:50S ribosomal protein L11 methyltransferase [Campylobacter lari]B9KDE1.1 RecName: Full=Ribosomal protein L11 methyltransferase; Short=L11 Mtase [Campylobacter lari RM2100]ACM64580.1 50S ribosomal protein L11 methyltransferase [Campylobacter lari RM2100]EAH6292988.1 50S ribosomal protein L11 methyltransferase [Campylobacter lari]EAI6154661.1 50S ribosomal protein L11 methyltransferase [Campylobacter lari]EAI7269028.1 50S ribosomal protein L11 methyltransferase [Campylobacter lari]EAI7869905